MAQELSKFIGVGTVLLSRIVHIDEMPPGVAPEDFITFLKARLNHICISIEAHSGVVLQAAGDDVLAFWHPSHTNPSHAQLAFNASRAILDSWPKPSKGLEHLGFIIHIALGTGQMGGDFFGPIRQFQIVGQAISIASRISRAKKLRRSVARMSQQTVDMINNPDLLRRAGRIRRGDLEPLRLFAYCPANNG